MGGNMYSTIEGMAQGTNSNTNGRDFENQVGEVLDQAGFVYRRQVRDIAYSDKMGDTPRIDFVLETKSGQVALECKWHGPSAGTIGQKLAYTRDWFSEIPIPSIIVLGGNWPIRVVSRVRAHPKPTVDIFNFDEFKVWVHSRG